MKNASVISIRLLNKSKKINKDLLSGNFIFTNVHAGGDGEGEVKNEKQRDVDDCSSDSMRVNIGDLADAKELEKIAHLVTTRRQSEDLSASSDQRANHLIEDARILHAFRTHSKDILTLLSEKDMASHLFEYGEQETGRKLLSIAAEVGWYEGVLFLLNRGVNINETDRENRTALIDCLTSTDTNILIALVKKPECNLDIQTRTDHTAAHHAVMMNKISFFEILIKSGARLDLCNDKGENVLHQIIEYRRKECWKIVKRHFKNYSGGFLYLQNLIHAETYEHQTCLTIAFKHRPKIYFLQELLPYVDKNLINIEVYHSWSKASKLIRDLFS